MALSRRRSRIADQEVATDLDERPAALAESACRLGWVRRHRRWWYALVALLLLAQLAVAMVTTATAQSPTIDEPVYAGAAAHYWQQGSLRYNPEHPPLGKLIIGAGLALADPRVDPEFSGNQSEFGRHLLYEAGNDANLLMLLARLPMIALTLGFGLVVFGFARDLAGPAGALVALALYAFSPNVIAHGSLATLDVATAGFLLTSTWLVWRARWRPRVYLPLAGAALGAAVATKMSALAAVPVLLLLAGASFWHARPLPRPAPRALASAVAAAAVGLLVIAVVWASYLAVDPRLQPAAPAPAVPVVEGLRGTVTDWLPFPASFRDGMRIQFGDEDAVWGGYLFGETYSGSRWYYLPAALLVKTPLGALALWLAGTVAMLAVPRLRPGAAYLLPAALVLLVAAMTGSRDLGIRYVIFIPMFLAVAAAAVAAVRWPRRVRYARMGVLALVLLVAVSSARTFPFYLPYANEAFGGPDRTYQHLHDSNVDWGQDLRRLADRLRQRYPDEPVWLAYKGAGVPEYYGIRAADPFEAPPGEVRGLLVVSNTWVATAPGKLRALIDSSQPIEQVGHSITIFRRR